MNLTWIGISFKKVRPELLFILLGVTLILVCLSFMLSMAGVDLRDIIVAGLVIGAITGAIIVLIAFVHWMEN